MKYGMVKVAAVTPIIKTGNVKYNAEAIATAIKKVRSEHGAEIAVFPELCICGYTCADLMFTQKLLDDVIEGIKTVAAAVPEKMLVFIGAPIKLDGRLYNCAIGCSAGKVLGVVPKTELPDYGEFYEKRYFTPSFDGAKICEPLDALMGRILFMCEDVPELIVGCEICEDMWADVPPSVEQCREGATVIVNLSASDEIVGKAEYRRLLVSSVSGRNRCAYVYADAGEGESTTDVVFSGHNMIAENGKIVAEAQPFGSGIAVTEIDIEAIDAERRRSERHLSTTDFKHVWFSLSHELSGKLERRIEKYPFVPENCQAELILNMQSRGLKTRKESARAKKLVLGVSGGLDSSLALLVCARAVPAGDILAVTMPAFGTTVKTRTNAEKLCAALGVEIKTVDIKKTVESHLKDIDHDKKDVVYENAQARYRTMTLFDLANKCNGLVVGTGDLSELALGWATYNGDHMSSYGVNAGVPKTLVKALVKYEAERLGGKAKEALEGVLSTDISPELLPPEDGKIAQKTEDILGKYDLLDFIIYYHVRYGFTREKIEFLLRTAFSDVKKSEIDKALDTFYKRFYAAQFKRSCLPGGVKIGTVSLSPRSDFRLPDDCQ